MFFPIFWEEGLKLQRKYYQLVDFLQRFAISFEHLLSSSGPLTVFSQRRGHRLILTTNGRKEIVSRMTTIEIPIVNLSRLLKHWYIYV